LEGQEQAWAALLARYSGLIHSIARKSSLRPDEAADVFQSVCLIILETMDKLHDTAKFSSWLTTITLRQCQRVKRQQRFQAGDPHQTEDRLANVPDDAPTPDEEIQQLEREQLVCQAIAMLDEPCQRLFTYLFYESEPRPYEAIADEMGLSIASIATKRRRCLKKLKTTLHQLGFFR
jgi:RNA polymerase sigma factor (sigma-70 family)